MAMSTTQADTDSSKAVDAETVEDEFVKLRVRMEAGHMTMPYADKQVLRKGVAQSLAKWKLSPGRIGDEAMYCILDYLDSKGMIPEYLDTKHPLVEGVASTLSTGEIRILAGGCSHCE